MNNLNIINLQNCGTSEDRVRLTQSRVETLVKIAEDTTLEEKHVSGYFEVLPGTLMTKGQEYKIKTLGDIDITGSIASDEFIVSRDTSGTVYEGTSFELVITDPLGTGITIDDLVIEFVHDITSDVTDEIVASKINLVGNRVVVDAPTDNYEWTDNLTINAHPIWDPSNIRSISVTVQAIKITSLTVTGRKSTIIGGQFDLTTSILPASNTKVPNNITRISRTCQLGTFDGDTYKAPNQITGTIAVDNLQFELYINNVRSLVTLYQVNLLAASGVYLVRYDGAMEQLNASSTVTDDPNNIAIGIAIVTSAYSFMTGHPEVISRNWNSSQVSGGTPYITNTSDATLDYDGFNKTLKQIETLGNTCAAYYCYNNAVVGKIEGANGKIYQGYLPAVGELKAASNNLGIINNARTQLGWGTWSLGSNDWWSSTEYSATNAWNLRNGNVNYNYNTGKAGSYQVVPFYAF